MLVNITDYKKKPNEAKVLRFIADSINRAALYQGKPSLTHEELRKIVAVYIETYFEKGE